MTINTSERTHSVRIAFAAIVVAMLPAVLDQTILSTALPTIAGDLGRLTDVAWVISAYVVAAAATTPLWGKLGDRHGRKRLLEASLLLFLVASAVSGAAQDMTWLIVSRTVQGAGAGGLMTLAMAAVGDLVAPRERARYQGYIAAAFAVATIVGPLLGGLLVQHASWRWVFYVNLPLGAVALAGLRFALPEPTIEPPTAPLDSAGAALLATLDGGDRAGLHLGRRPLRLDLADDHRADRGGRAARACSDRTGTTRRRPDRAAGDAEDPSGRRVQRSPVPGDRGAVLGHGVRAAVPADDDRSDSRRRPGCCSCRRCSGSPCRPTSSDARSPQRAATSAIRCSGSG